MPSTLTPKQRLVLKGIVYRGMKVEDIKQHYKLRPDTFSRWRSNRHFRAAYLRMVHARDTAPQPHPMASALRQTASKLIRNHSELRPNPAQNPPNFAQTLPKISLQNTI